MTSTTPIEGYIYNDYNGYFEDIVPEEALKQQENYMLFRGLEDVINNIVSISNDQQVQQIRKDELIIEMAMLFEQIYINCKHEHLIKTIAASMCIILTKKDKLTTPAHIYAVLHKKAKNKYASEYGTNKRTDIFALRNVRYHELRTSLTTTIDHLDAILSLDKDKQQEILELLNQVEDIRSRSLLELETSLYQDPDTVYNESSYTPDGLPLEREIHWNDAPTDDVDGENDGAAPSYPLGTGTDTTAADEEAILKENNPAGPFISKYFNRLGQYIAVLTKLRENVGRFPPSPELDEKLDRSLALEIEIIIPCIDMKFKRSLPQLDETVSYADNQSLNGASSVMHETALIESEQGTIVDFSRAPLRRYKEVIHKLTPEQIDTRHGYISNIRKKLATWLPHLYYNILYYEGSNRYNHHVSIGKLARSNLLKKKMEGKN